MTNFGIQQTVSRVLGFGVPLTSLFLVTSGVSDPVNVTKMLVAGGVGTACLLLFLSFDLRKSLNTHRAVVLAAALFLVAGLSAVIGSKAPVAQNLYGTYGRNTGFFTYVFMVGVLLCALQMNSEKGYQYLVNGLIVTGVINVLYCFWVIAFGDFISWSNPYGNILGLFGNPDFISAFLGMFITSAISLVLNTKAKILQRLSLILLAAVAFFEVIKSHAIQGIVVTLGGLTIIGFYIVYSKFSQKIFSVIYLGAVTVLGVLAVLGTLQKGPLKFVYKRSVSLRGSYWHAGIDMGNQNPVHGIGFDTYGDWYRRSRPPVALVDMPGVNIMSNVSHNVVIDFFASGGWPLLLSYIAILILGIRSIIRITKRSRSFNPIFVAMAATWMCYQVQSFISINQIGLTIWGWVLTGALISYDKFSISSPGINSVTTIKSKSIRSNTDNPVTSTLVASIGFALGIFIAAPAFNAETTWQSANQSRNLENVKKALVPTFMNPASSYKYAQAVGLLQDSNLLDLAHQYAVEATVFNPDYFDGWKQLYYLQNATAEEKNEAIKNMTRLDPLNPDVTQIR
jgi:O-antigen ligase